MSAATICAASRAAGIGPREFGQRRRSGRQQVLFGSRRPGVPLGLPKEFGISGRVFTDFGTLWSHQPTNIVLTPAQLASTGGISRWSTVAGDPRQRRDRRVMEIAGRSGPARYRLSDQEGNIRQDAVFPGQFRHEVLMSLLFRLERCAGWSAVPSLGGAVAQAPARRPRPRPAAGRCRRRRALTVLVVDVQALLQNSKAAKMVRRPDRAKAQRIYQGDLASGGGAADTERDTLQRQQASLSAEALEPKGPRIPAEGQRTRAQRAGQAPGAREIQWRGALKDPGGDAEDHRRHRQASERRTWCFSAPISCSSTRAST